jgi:hypothetical protein
MEQPVAKMLSPEQARQVPPHFEGLGAGLRQDNAIGMPVYLKSPS